MASLSWAMMLAQALYVLIFPTSLAFCGSLGKEAFDSASLAISLYQTVVVSGSSGMRWASLSLFSQTRGGTRPERLGCQVQRALLAGLSLSMVSLSLAANSANLLIHLAGQLPHLAVGAEQFLLAMSPCCVLITTSRVLVAYTDSLGAVIPTVVAHGIGFCVNLALQAVLVPAMGLMGSATAITISLFAILIVQVTYIVCSGVQGSWSGWSFRSFLRLGSFYKDLLPSVGFSVLEFLGFEMGSFLAGTVDATTLAAHSILFQALTAANLIPVGLESTIISRTAFHLGQASPKRAKSTFLLGTCLCGIVALLTVCVYLAMMYEIPKIFAADAETIDLYMTSFPLLLIFIILVILTYAMVSGMRATNNHVKALVITFVCFYPIFLTMALCILNFTDLGLFGMWLSYDVSMLMQLCIGAIVMVRVDWTARSAAIAGNAGEVTDVDETATLLPRDDEDKLKDDRDVSNDRSDTAGRKRVTFRQVRYHILTYCCVILLPVIAILIRIFLPPEIPQLSLINSTWLDNVTASVA